MRLSFNVLVVLFVFILTSCSSSKEKLIGNRIAVFDNKTIVASEYEKIDLDISTPFVNLLWNQQGGNELHKLPNLHINSYKKHWKADIGDGNSSRDHLIAEPVIAYDGIFTIDREARVSAYNLGDGNRVWRKKLKPRNSDLKNVSGKGAGLAVSVKHNKVFVTTGFGKVYALNMINGKKEWQSNFDAPIRIAPTIGENIMFVQTTNNELIALKMDDGSEIWRASSPIEETILMGGASPAYDVSRDVVISAFSNGEVRAYKASTGSLLWAVYLTSSRLGVSTVGINAVKSSPVIDGEKVYVAGSNDILVALNIRNGEKVWVKDVGTVNPLSVVDDYIFMLSNEFEMVALNKNKGDIIWSSRLVSSKEFKKKVGSVAYGPIMVNGALVVATEQGYAISLSARNGSHLGSFELDNGAAVSPVIANETIVFLTNNGKIIAYR